MKNELATKRGANERLREIALFAGAGGGILGGKILGWRTVCAVERDAYAADVLAQRQNDKVIEAFPIWSDVESFDGKPWCGIADVVSGGFPCQDISVAGKGKGIGGERSGLWRQFARVVSEIRPRFAFVENSANLTNRGLGVVLGDLASMGYDARWGVFCGCQVGKLHHRKRIFILANSAENRRGFLPNESGNGNPQRKAKARHDGIDKTKWQTLPTPEFWGGADGIPEWVQSGWRVIGNAQIPEVVALAWRTLASQ